MALIRRNATQVTGQDPAITAEVEHLAGVVANLRGAAAGTTMGARAAWLHLSTTRSKCTSPSCADWQTGALDALLDLHNRLRDSTKV
jgi:hypothetical protein